MAGEGGGSGRDALGEMEKFSVKKGWFFGDCDCRPFLGTSL